jgi:hypothetical protein
VTCRLGRPDRMNPKLRINIYKLSVDAVVFDDGAGRYAVPLGKRRVSRVPVKRTGSTSKQFILLLRIDDKLQSISGIP